MRLTFKLEITGGIRLSENSQRVLDDSIIFLSKGPEDPALLKSFSSPIDSWKFSKSYEKLEDFVPIHSGVVMSVMEFVKTAQGLGGASLLFTA
ncbi:hypothetical protein Tco_1002108 [Tanacetum coccineum]|uniref:Uncharacterized protein n=1 Tax=Tanacetum coccineum TaxID=301880 RepID=A0ABQ5F6P7_9ASTR